MSLRVDVTTLEDPLGRTFRYEFDGDRAQILLGRRGGVDILLPQAKVSLVHARIERRGDGYTLTDDNSTNGTRINGRALPTADAQPLRHGDLVAIGDFQLQVTIGDADGGAPAESPDQVARRMVRDVLERLGPSEVQPSLTILDGPQTGVTLLLPDVGRAYMLGRGPESALQLDDVDMWQDYCALERDAEWVSVRNLSETSALTVDGERVQTARVLHHGQIVRLGATALRFIDPTEVYLRKLEAPSTPDASLITPVAPSGMSRGELILIALGVVAILAAVSGLVWVLLG